MFDPHMPPDLAINGLRLLLEGYKVFRDRFRDKKTPERVEEIVIQAEKTPEKVAEIEQSLTKALEPSDAAIVKGDLELLSLLLLPTPKMDAFDYWSQLTKLVTGLHTYAIKNRLFELRGRSDSRVGGEALLLPKTGEFILPHTHAAELTIPLPPWQRRKSATAAALLKKNAERFPVSVMVHAEFNEYHSIGGPPSVISDFAYFSVASGRQRHWLLFERDLGSYHFEAGYEYMLAAADFISIVRALREDIAGIAADVRADEQMITPFFSAIDAFSKKIE